MSLKGRSCWVVNIRMVRAEKLSLETMGRFVLASEEIRFEAEDRHQRYGWVKQVLVGQRYAQCSRSRFWDLGEHEHKAQDYGKCRLTNHAGFSPGVTSG